MKIRGIMPIWAISPRVACRVPWRAATCAISCAITPASSDFDIRLEDQPRIDEEETTRKRKCVDRRIFDHLDRERNLRIRVADQILSYSIDVLGDHRIIDDFRLPLYLLSKLLAERNFLLERVEVYFPADVAVADRVRIFFFVVFRKSGKRRRQQERQGEAYGGSKIQVAAYSSFTTNETSDKGAGAKPEFVCL